MLKPNGGLLHLNPMLMQNPGSEPRGVRIASVPPKNDPVMSLFWKNETESHLRVHLKQADANNK
jgi:hypothetical protein